MTKAEGVEIIRSTGKEAGTKIVGTKRPESKGVQVVPSPPEKKDE